MKNYYAITMKMFILLFISTTLHAQQFQGEATYKTSRKLDFKIDSTTVKHDGINDEMRKKLNDMLIKQFQKEYKLTFTASESLYKKEESLAAPSPSSGMNMQVVVMGDGASDVLYKNTKESRYVNATEILGKQFLIKDELKKQDWKLVNETKNIGKYTCYKATREIEVQRVTSFSTNGKEDHKDESDMETMTITAWYTPEIPINAGPSMYWGLPGLILEVNDGSQTIVCSKIVLNPKNKVSIKEPTKGKKVTQKKFDEISMKKQKEQMERYRGRGDGEHMEIRIGG